MTIDIVELFDAHYDELARFLKRNRMSSATADDLVQQTFEQAWRCRATYDPTRATARAWLFGIAMNVMRHHFRAQGARRRAYGRAALQSSAPDDDIAMAIERLDARALKSVLDRSLTSLRRQHYEVLTLYAWADLTQQEIAAALDVPVGTVKTWLRAARTQMRELLQASLVEHSDG